MPDGNPWPLISIVTPSYNQGEFIEETIRSLLLQGYPNLEYIVMDGGSTDSTVAIIQKYSSWITHWVSEKDEGQSNAVNKGFGYSNGEILAWLNSDDTYEKNALSSVTNLMLQKPHVGVVYGNTKVIDENGEKLAEIRTVPFNSKAFLYETVHIVAQSSVFWRAKLFFEVGQLNEELHYSMDRELLLRFMENGAKFSFLRQPLGTYRCHQSSKTFGTSNKSRNELLSLKPFSQITQRSDYAIWRFIYRLRQLAYLTFQGDLPYMVARAGARFSPTAFDRL
jgi:glycosyltransferase involved in cell wall biosynthesis